MTTNPTRRRSAFAGTSAAQPAATPAPAPAKEAAAKKEKVGFYQIPEDSERMRATYRKTSGDELDESLSDFITKAIRAEVERREAAYNGGQPFELSADDGRKLKAGRPESSLKK